MPGPPRLYSMPLALAEAETKHPLEWLPWCSAASSGTLHQHGPELEPILLRRTSEDICEEFSYDGSSVSDEFTHTGTWDRQTLGQRHMPVTGIIVLFSQAAPKALQDLTVKFF